MNKRIQTETFKELSRHTRTSIREVFKSITKHLSTNDIYHKIIEIDQFNNDNNLSIELKRTRQLDQLVDETDGEVLEWISKRMNEISPSIDEIEKN